MDLACLRERIDGATAREVERALTREHVSEDDLPALFSEAAVPYLEDLAQRSAAVTERRFGKVMQLYTPLYLSNECVNRCKYCGFAHHLEIPRMTLTVKEALAEAAILYEEGFRHILLVAGESRKHVSMDYLKEVVGALHGQWDSIAIEINPLSADEYRQLYEVGVDGLTLYQETYDPELYLDYHPAGPKRHYANRLNSIEHGGEAGLRSLGIGALLGLGDWRFEAVMVALHARYLARRFWKSRVAVSFPRIRATAGGYQPPSPVGDRDLVQMLCAMRLIMPDSELVVSTREPARLRDRLVGLGVTRMSAGSRTNPGGYSHREDDNGEQFSVEDARSPQEVSAMLIERGYEPVWKDFDREFLRAN